MYTFAIEVPKSQSQQVEEFLRSKGVEYFGYARKAFDWPVILAIAAPSLGILVELYRLVRERKREGIEININVMVYDPRLLGPTQHRIVSMEEMEEAMRQARLSEDTGKKD